MSKAGGSGISLYKDDARQVLGMLARGDRAHDVAAWFGVNQARVAEVKSGEWGTLEMAPADQLPPSGPPGVKGRRARRAIDQALEALGAGNHDQAVSILSTAAAKYDANEQ